MIAITVKSISYEIAMGATVATGPVGEVTSVPFVVPVEIAFKPPVVREAVELPEAGPVGWPSTPTVTVEVTVVVEV